MLVKKINLYSSLTSNRANTISNQQTSQIATSNKINAMDKITFSGKILPKNLVNLANKVVTLYKKADFPVEAARNLLDKATAIPAKQEELAFEIIKKGTKFEAPVEINGKNYLCKASIGRYFDGDELCMDIGEGTEARRYRIEIKRDSQDFSKEAVSKISKIRVQKFSDQYYIDLHTVNATKTRNLDKTYCFSDFIPLDKKDDYTNAVSTVQTLLNALAKKNQ